MEKYILAMEIFIKLFIFLTYLQFYLDLIENLLVQP